MLTVVQCRMACPAQPLHEKWTGIIFVMPLDEPFVTALLTPLGSADLPQHDGVLESLAAEFAIGMAQTHRALATVPVCPFGGNSAGFRAQLDAAIAWPERRSAVLANGRG